MTPRQIRACVAKGESGYREFFEWAVEQEDLLDASCKGMDEETRACAVELAMADADLITILVSKAGPPKEKQKSIAVRRASFAMPPPAPASEDPKVLSPTRSGRSLREGTVECERLWLQPMPLLGRRVALGWKPQVGCATCSLEDAAVTG